MGDKRLQPWDTDSFEHVHEHHDETVDDGHDHSKCHEQRPHLQQQPQGKPKLPVTVLTGYLGSGKTTLLNHLLREQRDKKLAVIENEVGEVSIDDALVEQKHQDSVARFEVLSNGCVCCTVRNDLVTTLIDIAKAGLAIDGVLIELTGMADPAPVVQTFFMHDEVREAYSVDNVVALVDAKHALAKLDESRRDPEERGTACAQIAFSSTVLLNKVDLVRDTELAEIEFRIQQLNSTTEIIRCQNAVVPMSRLIGVGAFNLSKVLEEQYMEEEEFKTFYQSKMDSSISNVGIRCAGAVNLPLLRQFLDAYMGWPEGAADFLRVKAVLNIAGSDCKFVLQCVHSLRNQGFTVPWAEGELRENRIIFIGRNMQRRRETLNGDFQQTMAQPLRFEVGTPVQAKADAGADGYRSGRVVAQWDEYNAYRIALYDGEDIHVPYDDDDLVRAAPMTAG